MNKKIKLLFIFLFIIILCGCYDYDEPDDIAYVVAVGIDTGSKEGLYSYTIQFARPSQISGGASEQGGSGEDTIGTVTVESPSVYSAVNIANHVVSKSFILSHTKVIVLSDEISKTGIGYIINSIGRSSDIRPSVFICTSNGKASDYLKSVKPVIEINPVKYYRLIFENKNSSYVPKQNAKNVYFNLKTNENQIVLPLVGVGKGTDNLKKEKDDEKEKDNKEENDEQSQNNDISINYKGFEYKMKEYTAGKLDVKKQNESEVIGSCVFKDDKMIDYLTSTETELFNIITGSFKNSYSVIYNTDAPSNPTTIRIESIKKPSVKVKIINGLPKIYINIFLEGNLMSASDDSPPDRDMDTFKKDTSQYITEAVYNFLYKTRDKFDSDITGFGEYAKRNFLTYEDYKSYKWNEKYKFSEFFVNVNFNIRKTGLILKN